MKMQTLFSTDERERILFYLLGHPSQEINLSSLARLLKVSVGQVHKYIAIMKKLGLMKGGRLCDTAAVRALRVILNLDIIEKKNVVKLIRAELPEVKGIGVYGSWANGTNNEAADLDLWLKTAKQFKDVDVAMLRRLLEKKLGASIDLTIVTPERMEHFREKSDSFYFALFNSILLWGENL